MTPIEILYVPPRQIPAYSLAWRTPIMPAPAFWYFRTEPEAYAVARGLAATTDWRITSVLVPDTTPFTY